MKRLLFHRDDSIGFRIVAHKRFEMGCALLVILCALSIGSLAQGCCGRNVKKESRGATLLVETSTFQKSGVESDYTIRHALDPQHPVFRSLVTVRIWSPIVSLSPLFLVD